MFTGIVMKVGSIVESSCAGGSLERISREPCGVAVILRPPESPATILAAVHSLGAHAPRVAESDKGGAVLRTHGIGAQILHDLGVTRMRVLSAPLQLRGIAAFGLEIAGYED
ncbi:MAG: hypothetical protein EXR87_07460 [Gammaproteobacteria bacterium]|nr:hypothetical protein [Gammaproteobacteria bacterium]